MLKVGKSDRTELYKDRNTQVFLSKFLSGELKVLEPVYDPKTGYHYLSVEAIAGDASNVESFLNRLYEAGVLERKLHDKIIYCPRCASTSISIRYCCPYCKSFDVQKSSLIEHVKCGYMDIEENFHKGNKFVCPKCHEELKKLDFDHRKAGIWCTCKECGKSFDVPTISHFCRDCHGNFPFEDITIKDVYAYGLKEEVKEEASLGWVLVTPIREFLQEEKFEVESPAFLKGKSGANHLFDLVATRKQAKRQVVVIDIATSAEAIVSEQPVIALFAKIFDVSPDQAYLVAIPKINENGRKMAGLYNIRVIEAKDQREVVRSLKETMKI